VQNLVSIFYIPVAVDALRFCNGATYQKYETSSWSGTRTLRPLLPQFLQVVG